MQVLADTIWLTMAPVYISAEIERPSLSLQQVLGRAPCGGTAYSHH
jgi:transposase